MPIKPQQYHATNIRSESWDAGRIETVGEGEESFKLKGKQLVASDKVVIVERPRFDYSRGTGALATMPDTPVSISNAYEGALYPRRNASSPIQD